MMMMNEKQLQRRTYIEMNQSEKNILDFKATEQPHETFAIVQPKRAFNSQASYEVTGANDAKTRRR